MTDLSLRMRVVEAGARAIHEAQRTHFWPDWPTFDDLGDFGQRSAREFMAIALDAMLDCLAENADEWVGQAGWLPNDIATGNVRRDLLAVLREDRSP